MRYVGAITICLAALFIGLSRAREEKVKTQLLRELCSLLEIMKSEISDNKTALIKLFSMQNLNSFELIFPFIESINMGISSIGDRRFNDIWCGCVSEKLSILPEKSMSALLSLGNSLGRYDAEMQKSSIERCIAKVSAECEAAENSLKNNEKMYIGLGGGAGAILALMLI